jgi:hypothetical protein
MTTMNIQSTIFIASSNEGIPVAEAVNIKLENELKVKQWDNAFDLSSITINRLIQMSKEYEYGVFVFHKDDTAVIKGKEYNIVRDNVLFELGLFIGSLGLENCFVLIPKSIENSFRLPTDLSGVTLTFYDDQESEIIDAVTTSCAKIKSQIRKNKSEKTNNIQPKQSPDKALINELQSQLWTMKFEMERAREDSTKMTSSIRNHFFSIAKPATELEINTWEEGAKKTYLKEIKIRRNNLYFIDKDSIIPKEYGANSLGIIVANGVKIHNSENIGHNSIYYLEGFRKTGV